MSNHRYYINEFPEERTVVPIIPRALYDYGIVGDLPEYPGTNCIIKLPEMSKRNIKAFKKLKLDHITTAIVVKVDETTHDVDLSRRQMPPTEVASTLEKYYKAKKLASLVQSLSDDPIIQHQLYVDVIWPLYSDDKSAFDAIIDGVEIPHTTAMPYDKLVEIIHEKIKPELITISLNFKMQSTAIDGVKTIQTACQSVDIPITCIAPPTYMISYTTTNSHLAYTKIASALDTMRKIIVDAGGVFIGNIDTPTDSDDESVDTGDVFKHN